MANYKARYGFPSKEVENLAKRKSALDGGENWENIDHFVRWCSENGYQKGIKMRRYDPSKPHSPENSYFGDSIQEVARNRERKKRETRAIKSPFCEGCQKVCPGSGSGGCDQWQEYFQKNWDQNISIAPPKPEPAVESNAPMVFRYEHPDMVREGIVWQQTSQA